MTEITEKKLRNSSWLMWGTLLLIIMIQVAAWDFSKTPINTLIKVEDVQKELIDVKERLILKTIAIQDLTDHIKLLEANQAEMLKNQSRIKQSVDKLNHDHKTTAPSAANSLPE